MSTTIDQKVVEMRFDNQHFEKNVSGTLLTLDKLKEKLNLTGASKGLENLGATANKVNVSGLSTGVETVGIKFNALNTIADQTLRNITNRVEQTAERIVKTFTIDPIKTGFQEYETQINAIQTILANTQSKGTTLDDVNAALDELNAYADKTIYNFTEMTRNIGTFTAAGIDLDTSVNAIQGIANLAAVSGSTSQQASTAMYQLSQALATGTVKLMDWNSVVNAGMGGQVFQDALKETSRLLGTGADEAIKATGSFRESLREEWLTAEVLTETLKKFTTTGANEYIAEYTGLTKEAVDAETERIGKAKDTKKAIDEVAESLAKASGKSKEEIKQALEFAQTAEDAATKVKTFTQLWDVLKEAAQSGWTQTWELIVGDFEQAKGLLTPLSDFLTGFINKTSEWRNKLVSAVMNNPFMDLIEKIKNVTAVTDEMLNVTLDYEEAVKKVIRGEYGNWHERWDKLAAEGYDWCKVQNMVNEELGCSLRRTEQATDAQEKQAKSYGKTVEELVKMEDAQLKSLNFTDKEIESLRELEKVAHKTGYSVAEIVDNPDLISGRNLLIDAFKNIGDGIVGFGKAIKQAWADIFETDPNVLAQGIYNAIMSFRKFSESLRLTDKETGELNETGQKLQRTFRGIFAALDIVLTVVGGPIKIAFKILSQVLGAFDIDILSVTAAIGDMITKFRDFIDENNIVVKGIVAIIKVVKKFVNAFLELPEVSNAIDKISKTFKKWKDFITDLSEAVSTGRITIGQALATLARELKWAFEGSAVGKKIKEWINAFKELPGVKKFIDAFLAGFDELKSRISESIDIGKNVVEGLKQGLQDGTIKIKDAIIRLGKLVLETIKNILGIHSPSTEFFEIGKNVIQGFINGLQNGFSSVMEFFKNLGEKCVELVGKIDFGKVFAVVAGAGMIAILKKIGDALDVFSAPLGGIGDVLESTSEAIDTFKKTLKSFSTSIKAKAIKNIAISLAILVGSIIALAYVDSKFGTGALWKSVALIGALAVILGILAVAVEKMSDSSVTIGKDGAKMAGFNYGILAIGTSLLLLAFTVKTLGNMDPDSVKQGFLGLLGIIVAVSMVFKAYGRFVDGASAEHISKAGGMMLKLSVALLIMVKVAKMIAGMSWGDMGKAAVGILGFVGIVAMLTLISAIPNNNIDKLGGMMLKISGALLLMIFVAKIINGMEWGEMGKAAIGILGLIGIIALLAKTTQLAGPNSEKLGSTLMGVAGAMIILTIVARLIAGMEWGDMAKAGIGLLGLVGIVALLVKIVDSVGNDAPKIAGTILALSVAIGILGAVAILLGLVDTKGLAKGVIAVGLLGGVMALMIFASKGAQDCKGSIIAMAIAIGVMVAAAAILTLIDGKKLAGSVAALSVMMLSFAAMAKMASGLKNTMGSLIIMTVLVGLMGGMVYLLSKIPIESAIGAATSLSVLMISLGATMNIISKAGKVSLNALITIGALTLIVGALAGILYLIQGMPVQSTLANAAALSVLLLSLSTACVILNGASTVSPMALVAVGIMTLIVGALAGILYLIQDLPVQSTLANATALSTLLLALSAACVILTVVGLGGPAALIGVASLMGLIIGVGGLMVAIGALVDKFPKMETFIEKGIPILEKIGHGLGSFFGNIVGGFMEGVTDGLPGMATNLSTFMTNLQPFIDGAKTIDETALTGVTSLVKMVALVAGANFIESITSILPGGSSMENFATQINAFGDAIVAFSQKVKGNIDEESVMAAANAGKMLAEMQSMTAGTGGVVQFFTGDKDLATFGLQLLAFGDAIVGFSQKVSGNINEEAVMAAANAGTLMAEMQSKIVPSGGVVQWFTGEKDMATFGLQLLAFGSAIVGFSNTVKEGIDEEAVTAAATAGSIMTELQSKIVPTGGVVQWFTGKKDLSTFGTQLVSFGKAITGFSQEVSGNIDEEAVTAAANAGKVMVTLQKSIPEDKLFDGKVSLDDFGKTIKKFGGYIKSYSEKVTGIDTDAVSSSVKATKQIISITKSLSGVDPENIENFKAKKLGSALKAYSDKVDGIDSGTISSSISAIKKLVSLINSMASIDASGVSTFKSAISSLAKTNLDGIAESFSGAASKLSKVGSNIIDSIIKGMKSRQSSLTTTSTGMINNLQKQLTSKAPSFQNAGKELVTKLASGINSGKSKVSNAIKAPLTSAVSTIRGKYTSFYNAGSYVVSGFAAGISANTWRAEAKARAMANAAEKAAKKALDINSPSKVFRALGYSVPEGFAMGIDKMAGMAGDSAVAMSNNAINSVKGAIARVAEAMNEDIDSQPTIRPVLDLSDVQSGAGALSGMFDTTANVGVMSNVRSISSMMNSRNQNGTNDEIISELGKLRGALSNIGGNSYNINGITYNDDSPIADAMRAIVRATIMEGRA